MTNPDAVELDGGPYADLVKMLADLDIRERQIKNEKDAIKAQLRAELKRGHYTINGVPALSLTPTRRFDPEKAAEILPPAVFEAVARKVVDPTLAKQKLPPELYELCQKETPNDTVKLG